MLELSLLGPVPDATSPALKHIQDTCNVCITFKPRPQTYYVTVVVRGSVDNSKGVKEALAALVEKLAGNGAVVSVG